MSTIWGWTPLCTKCGELGGLGVECNLALLLSSNILGEELHLLRDDFGLVFAISQIFWIIYFYTMSIDVV